MLSAGVRTVTEKGMVVFAAFGVVLTSPGTRGASTDAPGVRLARSSTGLALNWPGTEAKPDGTATRPWFEVQFSADLNRWTPLGQRLRSDAGDAIEFSVPSEASHGFYRVMKARAEALAGTAEGGADVFGYGPAFHVALARIGQITPETFARTYASGADYLPGISWDPTTAKYWDLFDADPAVVNIGKPWGSPGFRSQDYRLDAREKELFLRNGFVVSQRLGKNGSTGPQFVASFGGTYYQLWYNDLPVFVSTDSVLHAWHRTFEMMLAEIEEFFLAPMLRELLEAMGRQLPAAEAEAGQGIPRDSLLDADYFVTVARSLLLVGGGVPSAFGQDARVAETLAHVQKLQLALVPDFMGHCRTVDFSQFQVRGHYARSSALATYFRCMMWLGRIDIPVAGGPFERCPGDRRMASPRELGTAIVLNRLVEASGSTGTWESIERTLAAFVGWSDALTQSQLTGLLAGAGIRSLSDITSLAVLERLQHDVQRGDLGIQNIRSDAFFTPLSDGNPVALPRSYLLFGQRFVPDSWALSQTVYDSIRWVENGSTNDVARRVPSALDVAFAVFGNDQVVPDLVARITRPGNPVPVTHADRFRDGLPYQHNLAAVRSVIDSQKPEAWNTSIAMGWMGALRELSAPTTTTSYPESMRTRAWAMRTLNTQLASWTQYRHDTVLYVKQSYTTVPLCFYPDGFVEPRPEFWRRLQALARNTAEALRSLPVPDGFAALPAPKPIPFSAFRSHQLAHLDRFAASVETLAGMAEKELSQTPFSDEEQLFIRNLMQQAGWDPLGSGGTPRYGGWYPTLFYRPIRYTELATATEPLESWNRDYYFHENYGCVAGDFIVADVHTDLPAPTLGDPGSVLHQGIGTVGLMLVAVDNGPDRTVYAGPVLSHYEFEVLGAPYRLTDSAWGTEWLWNGGPRYGYPLVEGIQPPPWTRDYYVPDAP